jgi:hypothetical protein
MQRSIPTSLFGVSVALAAAGVCRADVTLSADMTVDNTFTAYISASDNAPGTQFLTGNNWPTNVSGSTVLTAPGTYYLHVAAVDLGPPAMFIGLFSLTGTGASFANGTQLLTTEVTDWRVSAGGFDGAGIASIDIGPNGTGPWGTFPTLQNAHYIWAPNAPLTAYFSTTISVVPSPAGSAILALAGILLLHRRRSSQACVHEVTPEKGQAPPRPVAP